MSAIAARVDEVRARIARAAARDGRPPADVRLVAVAKGVSPHAIAEAVAAGVTDVGENRAQEMSTKRTELAAYPGTGSIRWHFVGVLQRNKVRAVVPGATLIHSVDSVALAEAIARRAQALDLTQDVLLEVNSGGEATKAGVAPDEAPAAAARIAALAGVALRGLMTVAPVVPELEAARPFFRELRRLRDRLVDAIPDARELSMGMSGDFEVAVEEGATLVRVGTAIFGARRR